MSDFFAVSPERLRFWVEAYRDRFQKNPDNMEVQKTMEFYKRCAIEDSRPSGREFDMEDDLRRSRDISEKCKQSDVYSQNLYAALCNNRFVKMGNEWGCGWRHAGGIVAHLNERGDYVDWYCSGVANYGDFVMEGHVTEEVRFDLLSIGWGLA